MDTPQAYDVVILGTGPAGLQAAIHAARKKVSVLVLGKETKSSLFHAHIENFCCIFNVPGEEILNTGRQQAAGFGAQFLEEDVLSIIQQAKGFELQTESGATIRTSALIIATGTHRNRLGVKGEKEFIGKGVSYCVDCDGNFYKGQTVAVVGNESAAVDGALTLTGIAAQVHLVCDRLDVSDALKTRMENSRVTIHAGKKVARIQGDQEVESLLLQDGVSIKVNGVFIELGAKGLLQLATTLGIALDDEMRYVRTDKGQATNLPGIYAAGDICGPPWQMAKAVGEGCVAGINAAAFARGSNRSQ
ncbi:MAG: FAD-dependent oxidoreductase [Desulfatitalea sp.]|nr:FAD-dependent oxidoreductase [Desulfatitalea sp.]NNJ99944.1 FAD-dependent oxidoreductase [Desulfatitalea sp.]